MDSEKTNALVTEWLTRHGATYSAEYVPQSDSRNSADQQPSLNWRVSIGRDVRGANRLTTDYMQGIGNLPGYPQNWPRTIYVEDYVKSAVEQGRALIQMHGRSLMLGPKLQAPDVAAVLYSLLHDSDVIDHPSFESWASELGMDPDSRKAEDVYRACLAIALQLRSIFGDGALAELRLILQDY